MSRGISESQPQLTLSLSALDGTPSTSTGTQITPSSFKKRFKFSSVSAKSKRFLSFRASASKDRGELLTVPSTTSPSHTTSSGAIGERQASDSSATSVGNFSLSPAPQSDLTQGCDQLSSDSLKCRPTASSTSLVQDMRETESPSLNLAQKRAKFQTGSGELGGPFQTSHIDDVQLSYAKSMEVLSNDFAEHVFPESPLFETGIPKSQIDIPYPSVPVSHSQRKSLGADAIRDAIPHKSLNIALPSDLKTITPVEVATTRLSPVAEIAEDHLVENRGSWLRLAQTVQRAAKHLSNDEDLSPVVLFQTLCPVVLLLYGIGAGVIFKRHYAELDVALGLTGALKPIAIFVVIVVGAITTLVSLKLIIWILTSLLNTFIDMDMEAVFHKGECVDADGMAVGESDLLLGGFLLASTSSPVVT